MDKDVQINVKIPIKLKEDFELECKKRGVNKSSLIRKWIMFYEQGFKNVPHSLDIPIEKETLLTKRISIRVSSELREAFNNKNKKLDIDGSQLINAWIYDFVNNE